MREIAFDVGPVSLAVEQLVKVSPIASKVVITYREGMLPNSQVMTLTDSQDHGWSTGEELIWAFVRSLGGAGEVNLAQIFAYFHGSPLGELMAATFSDGLVARLIIPGAQSPTDRYDPDAILADPDSHPLHRFYARLNIGIRDRGERWEKCPNCGAPYQLTAEWFDPTVCSEACRTAYAAYLESEMTT